MIKRAKKITAWCLALCLALSLLPGLALAEEYEDQPAAVEETDAAPVPEEETPGDTEAPPEAATPEETETEETPEPPEPPEAPDALEEDFIVVEEIRQDEVTVPDWDDAGVMLLAGQTWEPNSTTYGEQLDEYEEKLYTALKNAFENGKVTYRMDGTDYFAVVSAEVEVKPYPGYPSNYDALWSTYTSNTIYDSSVIENAIYSFTYDHPEYFWIRTAYAARTIKRPRYIRKDPNVGDYPSNIERTEFYTNIELRYIVDSQYKPIGDSAWNEKMTAVEAQINEILADCAGQPKVAQLAYFDYWLAENNTYNSDAARKGFTSYGDASPWNATSAFLKDLSPVCEGYAKAFQILCHRIGVPCITISGSGHMWNAVQLDGKWYYVDVTWNDPTITGSQDDNLYSWRTYFLISAFRSEQGTNAVNGHRIEQTLPTPAMANNDYFNTVWNRDVNFGPSGSGDNIYWIGQYAEANGAGQMLGLSSGYIFYWKPNSNRLVLPDVSVLPGNVKSLKVFTVSKDGYKPADTAVTENI